MGFTDWNPSHTILALFIVAGFVGQVAVLFHRMGQAEKRQARSEERAEKRDAELLALIDKRITEVNLRIGDVNLRIDSLHSKMDQGFSDIRSEMNQRFSDMQVEIRDVRLEMSKLNQNHIEHLMHHE